MRALVIVHDPGSEGGMVGARLEDHGYEPVEMLLTPEVGNPVGSAELLGDPTDYDVVVPMGSTYSLTDTDRIGTWIHDELDFLRRADAAGVPVMGICFGGQALAAAHGGRVVRSEQVQVGWCPLEPHVEAPLAGPWMQWHYDRFDAPVTADVLAADEVGTQAFTLRRNLALQFHPEVNRVHLQRWMDLGAVYELDKLGVDADDLLDQTESIEADARARAGALVDWFLSDIATR